MLIWTSLVRYRPTSRSRRARPDTIAPVRFTAGSLCLCLLGRQLGERVAKKLPPVLLRGCKPALARERLDDRERLPQSGACSRRVGVADRLVSSRNTRNARRRYQGLPSFCTTDCSAAA